MKSDIKSLVTLAAGISLCGVTGYFLYLLFKKDTEYSDYNDTATISGVQQKIEMRIPTDVVRAVIGRNGSNVKDIERKADVKIHFRDTDDPKNRICVIRGSRANCEQAESSIHEFLSNMPVIQTKEQYVPNITVGKIIGRGGERINHITQASGAKLRVSDFADRNDTRRITIKGTTEQINLALSYITQIVQDDLESREKLERQLSRRSPRGKSKNGHNNKQKEVVQQTAEKLSPSIAGGDGLIEVYVSALTDPSQFWVQIFSCSANQLDRLVEEMTEYYSKPENQSNHLISNPSVGEIVAASFQFDDKWYRAEVTEIVEVEKVPAAKLYFLDYGDTDVNFLDDIFELRTDFLRLRFQAIECCLARVKPVEDTWSTEATDLFEELSHTARWKKLRAKVTGYKERDSTREDKRAKREGSPIPAVDLYDIDIDVDIGLKLVNLGYAVYEGANEASENPKRTETSVCSKSSVDENCEQLVNGHSELSSVVDPSENAQNQADEPAETSS